MNKLRATVVLVLALNFAHGHVAFWNTPNHLHPVRELYVKPSVDGITGDLYVAATEENGANTQWLTDQPINFLPTVAAQQAPVPISYASSLTATALPHDESVVTTQKRAVLTSPAIKYTYALPAPGAPDANAVPYPYGAIPAPQPIQTTDGNRECVDVPANHVYPQYSPYHFYYPQMLSAFANALNAFSKETGHNEDSNSSAAPQTAPMWPYSYPVQYVMVDPTKWAQGQVASVPPQATPAAASASSGSEEIA